MHPSKRKTFSIYNFNITYAALCYDMTLDVIGPDYICPTIPHYYDTCITAEIYLAQVFNKSS